MTSVFKRCPVLTRLLVITLALFNTGGLVQACRAIEQRSEGARVAARQSETAAYATKLAQTLAELRASQRSIADLPPQQQVFFRALSDVYVRPRIAIVDADVQGFAREFVRGAQTPEAVFKRMSAEKLVLVKRWYEVPSDRRIFIIGSGRDDAPLKAMISELENKDYRTFFYMDCRTQNTLCSNEEVGAFANTSGLIVLADSPNAAASRFVKYELDAALSLAPKRRRAILISRDDLNALGGGMSRVKGVRWNLDHEPVIDEIFFPQVTGFPYVTVTGEVRWLDQSAHEAFGRSPESSEPNPRQPLPK